MEKTTAISSEKTIPLEREVSELRSRLLIAENEIVSYSILLTVEDLKSDDDVVYI